MVHEAVDRKLEAEIVIQLDSIRRQFQLQPTAARLVRNIKPRGCTAIELEGEVTHDPERSFGHVYATDSGVIKVSHSQKRKDLAYMVWVWGR
jgi:hypothetical protein